MNIVHIRAIQGCLRAEVGLVLCNRRALGIVHYALCTVFVLWNAGGTGAYWPGDACQRCPDTQLGRRGEGNPMGG